MKEKMPKVEKIKKPKKKREASSLLFAGLSLFLTIALFVGLVIAQSYLLEDVTYKQIVAARKDIPANTIITIDNAEEYLTIKSVNILDATDGSLTNADALLGQKAIVPLYAGEIVSLKDFENINIYTKDIAEPIEISIKISDIANADGGKIRAGDIVNLTMMYTNEQLGYITPQESYTVSTGSTSSVNNSLYAEFESVLNNQENETVSSNNIVKETKPEPTPELIIKTDKFEYNYNSWNKYVIENLYVSKVLDSSGNEIDSTDTKSSASILMFVIDKKYEAEINNALSNCSSMRISKVMQKPAEAFIDIETEEITDISGNNLTDTNENQGVQNE